MAVATRNRLHGTKWPSTNPKRLVLDYLTAPDALRLTNGELVVPEEFVSVPRQTETDEVSNVTKLPGEKDLKEEEEGRRDDGEMEVDEEVECSKHNEEGK